MNREPNQAFVVVVVLFFKQGMISYEWSFSGVPSSARWERQAGGGGHTKTYT